jgi:hypothetical protein
VEAFRELATDDAGGSQDPPAPPSQPSITFTVEALESEIRAAQGQYEQALASANAALGKIELLRAYMDLAIRGPQGGQG